MAPVGPRALLGALAVLALLAAALSPPGAEAGVIGDATLSIEVDRRDVTYGERVEISGQLEGELLGDNGGYTIELWAKPYPYTSEETVATTTTSSGGGYSFTIEPEYNTRYRVVEQGGSNAASEEARVWVYGRGRWQVRQPFPFVISVVKIAFSPELPTELHDRRTFLYFKKAGKPRYKPVDDGISKLLRPGKVEIKHRFQPPFGRYRFRLFWCMEVITGNPDIGIGRPEPRQDCPRGPFKPGDFFGKTADDGAGPLSDVSARLNSRR